MTQRTSTSNVDLSEAGGKFEVMTAQCLLDHPNVPKSKMLRDFRAARDALDVAAKDEKDPTQVKPIDRRY